MLILHIQAPKDFSTARIGDDIHLIEDTKGGRKTSVVFVITSVNNQDPHLSIKVQNTEIAQITVKGAVYSLQEGFIVLTPTYVDGSVSLLNTSNNGNVLVKRIDFRNDVHELYSLAFSVATIYVGGYPITLERLEFDELTNLTIPARNIITLFNTTQEFGVCQDQKQKIEILSKSWEQNHKTLQGHYDELNALYKKLVQEKTNRETELTDLMLKSDANSNAVIEKLRNENQVLTLEVSQVQDSIARLESEKAAQILTLQERISQAENEIAILMKQTATLEELNNQSTQNYQDTLKLLDDKTKAYNDAVEFLNKIMIC